MCCVQCEWHSVIRGRMNDDVDVGRSVVYCTVLHVCRGGASLQYLLWHPALAVPRTLVYAAVLQHDRDDVADAVAVWCPVERRAGSRHTRAR
jgi:hypothetical protein